MDVVEIDLESVDEGEWFFYQDSHFDHEQQDWVFSEPSKTAKIRVRRMQPFIQKRLQKQKKEAEHILNPKTRSMERITYYKDQTPEEAQKNIDDTWDYVITGLEGFKNKKTGKDIECTRENKLKLIEVPAFDRFIAHCLKLLEGSEAKRKEEAEKNLSNG